MRGTPTIEELVRMAMEARLRDVWVSLPGIVVSVSGVTADIRPVIQRPVPTPDEDYLAEELPVIPAVPLLALAGGGFAISFPVAVGDEVLLVFCTMDPAEWLRTGEVGPPPDRRIHSLAHAFAIPARMRTAVAAHSATDLVIAKDGGVVLKLTASRLEVGGSTDSVPRDSLLQSELAKIQATLLTGSNSGGAVVFGTPYTAAPTASALLKVGG